MWKPFIPAAVLACLAVSPLYASHGATTSLPATAPLPESRPAADAASPKQGRLVQALPISTSPQAIPETRLNVRLIGPGFPPPSAREFDFTADRSEPAMMRFVEEAVAATFGTTQSASVATSIASAE